MTKNLKPLATALNEITVTITGKVNFHKTFYSNKQEFMYLGKVYKAPIESTYHYKPSFWALDRKLGYFFQLHKTLASLFDWFNFRKKIVPEIGYCYKIDEPEPMQLKSKYNEDWALINYNWKHNSTVEDHFKAADKKLRGDKEGINVNWILIVGIIVVGIVALIVLLNSNSHQAQQTIQNVTIAGATPFNGGP